MSSQPETAYSGFNLETGDRVLFFIKVGVIALVFLSFGVGATSLITAAACAAMGYEWFRLTTREHDFDEPVLGIALAAAALPPFIAFAAGPAAGIIIALLAAGFLLFMGPKDIKHLEVAAPGIFLIGLAGVCFVWLRSDAEHGLAVTAWLIFVVAATELGSGMASERTSLMDDYLSDAPKEAIVGLVCGVLAGIIVAAAYREGNVAWVAMASFLIAGVVLFAGAVTEYLKRRLGTGPSGSLFLGRGTVLENFDGLICASIVAGFLMLVAGALFAW